MLYYADLHLHSRYSRAVSKNMDLEHLYQGALVKGLNLLGTGDFTHPIWFKELHEKLEPAQDNEGFFFLHKQGREILYMLTAEVCTIASTPKGVKKVHYVLHAQSFDEVKQLNDLYSKFGSLSADGRPIFGKLTPPEFVERTLEVAPKTVIVPAHAWTPWFSVFGSRSGFDSLSEAFEDQAKHIFAIETGLSSNPEMNWRLSQLDEIALMSNSDSHSPHPWRLGRECNAFEFERDKISFNSVFDAVRKHDSRHFVHTIEVDPNYGKYHYDGHRLCNFSCQPSETRKLKGICPVCKRPLIIGVLNRVEELADRDRPVGFKRKKAIAFKSILPLHELLAAFYHVGLSSKKVEANGGLLLSKLGSELHVLLNSSREELGALVDSKLVDLILLNRAGELSVKPGFDGEYGVLQLNAAAQSPQEHKPPVASQHNLGEFT